MTYETMQELRNHGLTVQAVANMKDERLSKLLRKVPALPWPCLLKQPIARAVSAGELPPTQSFLLEEQLAAATGEVCWACPGATLRAAAASRRRVEQSWGQNGLNPRSLALQKSCTGTRCWREDCLVVSPSGQGQGRL